MVVGSPSVVVRKARFANVDLRNLKNVAAPALVAGTGHERKKEDYSSSSRIEADDEDEDGTTEREQNRMSP